MIGLRLLGGLSLVVDHTGSPAAGIRPRLLALLALLAGHRSDGISRDKLLAYLWPDSDWVHARNSLKQAVFSLQHALDCRLLIGDSGFLRLDRSVAVDLWDFESALQAEEETWAVRLYRGPFLDGFYVGGLAEFEHWVEAYRQRLHQQYARTLWRLAIRADRLGDRDAAVVWWRRLAAAEPLSAIPALGLMRALQAAGDPTGALDHGRRHAALVEAELGAPVSDQIQALMRRLAFEGRTPKPAMSPRLHHVHYAGAERARAPSAASPSAS